MMSSLLWLAVGLGLLVVTGLWSRLKAPLAMMLGGMAPAHKVTAGQIAMAVAGIPMLAGLMGLFGLGWRLMMPRLAMYGLYGSPVLAFVFGLGYAVYRIGRAESSAAAARAKPAANTGFAAPDVAANAVERFNAGLQVAFGAMIALTTGTCTMMMVAYGANQNWLTGTLFMLVIGAPLPGAGIWMVVHGSRRLQASYPQVLPAAGPPAPPAPGHSETGSAAVAAAMDGTEDRQTLRHRNRIASSLFALAGIGVLLATMIHVFSDSYPSTRQVGTWAFQIVLGSGILGLGLWLTARTQALPSHAPGPVPDSPPGHRPPPAGARAAVTGAARAPTALAVIMLVVGGVLVLAGGAFATIGTPVVFQQMFWGGGAVYEAHRVTTLAIAWAVPVFGVVLVRSGWRQLRRRPQEPPR